MATKYMAVPMLHQLVGFAELELEVFEVSLSLPMESTEQATVVHIVQGMRTWN